MNINKYKNIFGFSLLEILIVIAILTVVVAVGVTSFSGLSTGVQLEDTAELIVSDLKDARSRAMQGENGLRWGVHFVNNGDDYFAVFSTPTDYSDGATTVVSTTTLPGSVEFSDPGSGTNKDIIFDNVAGTSTLSSVTLQRQNISVTVTTTADGLIYK